MKAFRLPNSGNLSWAIANESALTTPFSVCFPTPGTRRMDDFHGGLGKNLTAKRRGFGKKRLIFHPIIPILAASFLLYAGGVYAMPQATLPGLQGLKESLCKGKYWW